MKKTTTKMRSLSEIRKDPEKKTARLASSKFLGEFTQTYTLKVRVTVARWEDGQWEIRGSQPDDLEAELKKMVREHEA